MKAKNLSPIASAAVATSQAHLVRLQQHLANLDGIIAWYRKDAERLIVAMEHLLSSLHTMSTLPMCVASTEAVVTLASILAEYEINGICSCIQTNMLLVQEELNAVQKQNEEYASKKKPAKSKAA